MGGEAGAVGGEVGVAAALGGEVVAALVLQRRSRWRGGGGGEVVA